MVLRTHARDEARHLRRAARAAIEESHDGGIDEAADRYDARLLLRTTLDQVRRLPAIDRDVILLQVYGGLTYDQIADQLRIPIGTVRSRLNRVRTTLRRITDTDPEQEHPRERIDTAAPL